MYEQKFRIVVENWHIAKKAKHRRSDALPINQFNFVIRY